MGYALIIHYITLKFYFLGSLQTITPRFNYFWSHWGGFQITDGSNLESFQIIFPNPSPKSNPSFNCTL